MPLRPAKRTLHTMRWYHRLVNDIVLLPTVKTPTHAVTLTALQSLGVLIIGALEGPLRSSESRDRMKKKRGRAGGHAG